MECWSPHQVKEGRESWAGRMGERERNERRKRLRGKKKRNTGSSIARSQSQFQVAQGLESLVTERFDMAWSSSHKRGDDIVVRVLY